MNFMANTRILVLVICTLVGAEDIPESLGKFAVADIPELKDIDFDDFRSSSDDFQEEITANDDSINEDDINDDINSQEVVDSYSEYNLDTSYEDPLNYDDDSVDFISDEFDSLSDSDYLNDPDINENEDEGRAEDFDNKDSFQNIDNFSIEFDTNDIINEIDSNDNNIVFGREVARAKPVYVGRMPTLETSKGGKASEGRSFLLIVPGPNVEGSANIKRGILMKNDIKGKLMDPLMARLILG